MFKLLANLTVRRSWIVVLCAAIFAGVAGYYGGPVASLMTNGDGDFDDPASESVAAEERLSEAADANPGADIVALIDVGESVKSPAGREKVREVAEVIGDDRATARVLSYFETGDEAMISEDGESTYVVASFDPDADDGAAVERLQKEFADAEGITLGGGAVVGPQVGRIIGEGLARAEMLAFPILFVLLLWIFRGLVAALLPETALLLAASPRSIPRLLRFMAGVSRLHPAQPYWYLEVVGVEPAAQGLGVGTRLLEPVLARADEAGQRCYLETMTERNVAWYGTLGFEVVRAGVSFSPGGPPNWTMLRHPRQR